MRADKKLKSIQLENRKEKGTHSLDCQQERCQVSLNKATHGNPIPSQTIDNSWRNSQKKFTTFSFAIVISLVFSLRIINEFGNCSLIIRYEEP